tara:strand:- start:14808 stop:15638 length:831 start_codon:yes stop_codon:yes gene_type:complete
MNFETNFYIRKFSEHLKENCFLEKPHGHDFYLMLLVTKGSGTHIIDSQEYTIEPGASFLISPGQVHQWELSKDTDGYVLFFKKEYLLLEFSNDKLIKFPFFKSEFCSPYVKLEAEEQVRVMTYYDQIEKEYKGNLRKHNEMICMYLYAMFIELHRIYDCKTIKEFSYNYESIQFNQFETLIDTYFDEHYSLPFYAKKMNITLKQLSYLCKKVVGKTPSEVLMDRIILEAKRLLIHSDLSVSSISAELNYTDNSYFIRIFKKICAKTPEQFRVSFSA